MGVTPQDVSAWPCCVGCLVKLVASCVNLHSHVVLLMLYWLWAGERLTLAKAVPEYRRCRRSMSVSPVPPGPGIEIWCSC